MRVLADKQKQEVRSDESDDSEQFCSRRGSWATTEPMFAVDPDQFQS